MSPRPAATVPSSPPPVRTTAIPPSAQVAHSLASFSTPSAHTQSTEPPALLRQKTVSRLNSNEDIGQKVRKNLLSAFQSS